MTRPENVRCENCCYWDQRNEPLSEINRGLCCAHPVNEWPATLDMHFCGEFRGEWPIEET